MPSSKLQTYMDASAPVIVPGSKKKAWQLFLGSFVFVAGIIWLLCDDSAKDSINPDDRWGLIAAASFFSLGLLLGIYQILVPKSVCLILDETGFTSKVLWRSTLISWRDVESPFATVTPPVLQVMDTIDMIENPGPPLPVGSMQKFVCFNMNAAKKRGGMLNRMLSSYNSGIVNKTDLSTLELVNLLNHWRDKSLK